MHTDYAANMRAHLEEARKVSQGVRILEQPMTTGDLNWWLTLAPTLEWTFARTYAETAPHSYVF